VKVKNPHPKALDGQNIAVPLVEQLEGTNPFQLINNNSFGNGFYVCGVFTGL